MRWLCADQQFFGAGLPTRVCAEGELMSDQAKQASEQMKQIALNAIKMADLTIGALRSGAETVKDTLPIEHFEELDKDA
jgi:hypothetical protein